MALLGERLRQAREARGLATLQVEIETRIRANLIEALEKGDYESLPPDPFLRGLIRTYSTYLGLDSEEMTRLYQADITPPPTTPPPREPPFRRVYTPPPPPAPRVPTPEEPPVPMPPPPAAPVRKPVAARFPTPRLPLRRPPLLKPNIPPPAEPPETLAPPEALEVAVDLNAAPVSLAHLTRRPTPLPLILLMGMAVVLICFTIGLFAAAQLVPMITSLAPMPTSTRVPATRTPTTLPGAVPTGVPTLVATAPPFTTIPGAPSPTLKVTPRRTPDTFAGLHFDVQVTQTITLQVGVDGVMVFSGQMQPDTSRSWSAKDSLYVRVENPRGAILLFNGSSRPFAPRVYAETRLIERQWSLNDMGTPISKSPVPPPTLTPPAAVTPTLAPTPSPPPTVTSTLAPSPSPLPTTTPTVTATHTAMPLPTPTRTETPTSSAISTDTPTPSATPSATPSETAEPDTPTPTLTPVS